MCIRDRGSGARKIDLVHLATHVKCLYFQAYARFCREAKSYLTGMGFPFRCRELIESDAALARAARAAPRPGWAGAVAHRARAVALAGSVRPYATSGRSPAGRRLPVPAGCGTAARGCASCVG